MRERVSQNEVVRNWLARELRKQEAEHRLTGRESDWELMGKLFALQPFQAAFVWRSPVAWYRTTLSESAFRRLRVIEGPPHESWRELSPDGTILGAARRILDSDLRGTFEDIDVDHVRRLASGDPPTERPVLFRRGSATPYVADGNHYTTARAVRLLRDGEYVPQEAYLGVRRYPSVR
ncbi:MULTISPECIES: hypothetical protein [Halorussus]|uniref:hypothetical protein n=1 Tax=Halorussus TaxID=1070314 RepID=UPI0020A198EF|nr:hypothetical protein [Halorussus vallis]USZ75087.1 hypothetical protein NGM07_16830 [Halorussus vallis]